MKILVLESSPHRKGNTVTITELLLQSIHVKPLSINYFRLNDLKIEPCQGCFHCAQEECFIDDDMKNIYPEYYSADTIIFATPIFWWNMNAQMKLCIDRMTALLKENETIPALYGKRIILIVTYKFRETAESTIKMFKDFIKWINIELEIIEYCSLTEHVNMCEEKKVEIKKLGEKLSASY